MDLKPNHCILLFERVRTPCPHASPEDQECRLPLTVSCLLRAFGTGLTLLCSLLEFGRKVTWSFLMPLTCVVLLLWYSWPRRTIFRPLNSAHPKALCYYTFSSLAQSQATFPHLPSGSGPCAAVSLSGPISWPHAFFYGWETAQMCGYLVKPGLA